MGIFTQFYKNKAGEKVMAVTAKAASMGLTSQTGALSTNMAPSIVQKLFSVSPYMGWVLSKAIPFVGSGLTMLASNPLAFKIATGIFTSYAVDLGMKALSFSVSSVVNFAKANVNWKGLFTNSFRAFATYIGYGSVIEKLDAINSATGTLQAVTNTVTSSQGLKAIAQSVNQAEPSKVVSALNRLGENIATTVAQKTLENYPNIKVVNSSTAEAAKTVVEEAAKNSHWYDPITTVGSYVAAPFVYLGSAAYNHPVATTVTIVAIVGFIGGAYILGGMLAVHTTFGASNLSNESTSFEIAKSTLKNLKVWLVTLPTSISHYYSVYICGDCSTTLKSSIPDTKPEITKIISDVEEPKSFLGFKDNTSVNSGSLIDADIPIIAKLNPDDISKVIKAGEQIYYYREEYGKFADLTKVNVQLPKDVTPQMAMEYYMEMNKK